MAEISVSKEDGVGAVTIRNAARRNVLTDAGIDELIAAFDSLEQDPSIRCALLRGEGTEAFSAGYDLTTLSQTGKAAEGDHLHVLLDRVELYPFPIVACLRGYAIGGGCELSLACDVRVAGDDVRMGMPPAKLGLVYPVAGHARFLRTVGLAATKEIFFSGRIFTAPDCVRLGLVSVVTPAPEAEDAALRLAREIAGNAPFSLTGSKQILRHLSGGPRAPGEDEAALTGYFARSLATEDLAEGKRALAEKRKPCFTGK